MLSNITLTRRVVPEFGSEHRIFQSKSENVEVESKSRFGDPDEEPDLSCIHAGLRKALPTIDIIPTATFWEQIDAPQNAVELTELFATPQSDWLRALQADVLVIAYHARIDLESDKAEFLYGGWISDDEKETASVIVVDLSRKTIIYGSSITFIDMDAVGHGGYIIPFAFITLSPSNICKTVAEQAGRAIVEAMPDRAIRALVVVAAEDPSNTVRAAEDQQTQDQTLKLLQKKASQGSRYIQYDVFLFMRDRHIEPVVAWGWLCKAADQGYKKAQVEVGYWHYELNWEHSQPGHIEWLRKAGIQADNRVAYMWYTIAANGDSDRLRTINNLFSGKLTKEEIAEANDMVRNWKPGQCPPTYQ